ncbi:hypothetical protein KFE98_01965 [bacterium SCSIO 12741]|nr:hypothetical protein KFE98_01965 [bacterium SCSIO 12741]
MRVLFILLCALYVANDLQAVLVCEVETEQFSNDGESSKDSTEKEKEEKELNENSAWSLSIMTKDYFHCYSFMAVNSHNYSEIVTPPPEHS